MATGGNNSSSCTTIFHQLLNPNVTEGHIVPSVDDLKDEAYIIESVPCMFPPVTGDDKPGGVIL
ncbi:uncharacterized protein TrAFT101_010751 [Trichoderma asperellum]|uniref:uncharacterized protein n=1 Tax=Trichoderma asperellum TaxID=101201 RepID=UPI0033171DFB|nr:hypothetical protein TrAFT101_010751 [Trichoderma asperellum]